MARGRAPTATATDAGGANKRPQGFAPLNFLPTRNLDKARQASCGRISSNGKVRQDRSVARTLFLLTGQRRPSKAWAARMIRLRRRHAKTGVRARKRLLGHHGKQWVNEGRSRTASTPKEGGGIGGGGFGKTRLPPSSGPDLRQSRRAGRATARPRKHEHGHCSSETFARDGDRNDEESVALTAGRSRLRT